MTKTPTIDIAEATSSALVRRFVNEVLNQGQLDAIVEIVDPEYRYEGPDGQRLRGPHQLQELIVGFHTAFSDFHAEITSEIENGPDVAMTMTLTGTHDGDFDGLAPTGARMSLPIAVFTRVENGQIVNEREFYDTATLLAQLGAS